MQIKKYLASTLQEAVDEMRGELGNEAIILSTRILPSSSKIADGKQFEVIAVIDEHLTDEKEEKEPEKKKHTDQPEDIDNELTRLREKIFKTYHPEDTHEDQAAIMDDIADDDFVSPAAEMTAEPRFSAPANNTKSALGDLKDELLDKDIKPALVNRIIEQVSKQMPFIKTAGIDQPVISAISSLLNTASFGVKKRKQGKIVALVGPTGVGKTTCIAKLAVISKILHRLDVGLITLDTYRLGAIDQLKVFSQISDIDFHVAYDSKDLPKWIQKFKKKDIIFLDTAGRSQNNMKLLGETKQALNKVAVDELFLVLSSTSTTSHIFDVAKKFSVLNYSGFIFTKIDEAASYGSILNLSAKYPSVPVKFLTNGQVIPDDIIAAETDFIANMIFTGRVI